MVACLHGASDATDGMLMCDEEGFADGLRPSGGAGELELELELQEEEGEDAGMVGRN